MTNVQNTTLFVFLLCWFSQALKIKLQVAQNKTVRFIKIMGPRTSKEQSYLV
jgi:hypothetical protein